MAATWELPTTTKLFTTVGDLGVGKLATLGVDDLSTKKFGTAAMGELGASKGFARAFADTERTAALLSSLRSAGIDKQFTLPTAMGATAAIEAARPLRGMADSNLLAGVTGQLAGLETALLYREPGFAKALFHTEQFGMRWTKQFAGLAEAMRRLIEEQHLIDERTNEFVRRYGWPIPHSLPEVSYRKLTGLIGEPQRVVNRAMVEAFRPGTKLYRSARSVLDESQHFEPRRPLLKQVWRAQRQRQWYLVVNALLPLVEGVLGDVMFPTAPARARPKTAKPSVEALADLHPDVAGPLRAAETVLLSAGGGAALFDKYEPPRGVEPRTLNRNAVLHGIARRYGTEQNATKLFMLLGLMAECFELKDIVDEEKRRERKQRKRERDRAAA